MKVTDLKVFVLFVALVIVASLIGVKAFKAAPSPLKDNIEVYSLVDSANNLTIDTLLESNDPVSFSWVNHDDSDLNFGYSNDTYWIKINLIGPAKSSQFLNLDYSLIDLIEFYEVQHGKVVAAYHTGDAKPFSSRVFNSSTFTFPFNHGGNGSELYLKVHSEGILKLPINLLSASQLIEKTQLTSFVIGSYFGFMLFAVIGCLIVFGISQYNTFFCFSVYFFFSLLYGLNFSGVLFQRVWPNEPELNQYATNILGFLLIYSQLVFVEKYLNISREWHVSVLTLSKIASLTALCFTFAPGLYTLMSFFSLVSFVFVALLSCGFSTVFFYQKTGRRYKELYFALAWIFYTLALAVMILDAIGIVFMSDEVRVYVIAAFAMQIVFLVAAMVDSYEAARQGAIKDSMRSVQELEQRQIIERHMLFQATHDNASLLPKKQVLLHNWPVIKEYIPVNRQVNVVIIHFEGYYSIVLAYGQEVADMLVLGLHDRIKKEVQLNKQFVIVDVDWNNDKAVVLDSLDVCLVYVGREGEDISASLLALHKHVSNPFRYQDIHLDVEVAIGLCELTGAETISSAIRKAQVAAKESSHRKYCLLEYKDTLEYDPKYINVLLSKFKKALENNGLDLVFQPQVNTQDGSLFGVEALLRWSDEDEGVISPEMFIPIIEQSSLINDLTDFVIKRAFIFYSHHVALFGPGIQLSINLSARNFLDKGLIKYVSKYLIEFDVDPKKITFELTETVVLGDLAESKKTFDQLLDMGINLALDDFGTGYSSLLYLKELPFSELKIDKGFLVKDFHTKQGAGLVKAAIALGKSLDMLVVAEGVESLELAKQLKRYGCTVCQGYYFAKPMREDGFYTWYKSYKVKKYIIEE
ncbi:EAL domain-containing protein [Marinomonas algicola]|uniref:EAL domain-containing protein n=1 Tax=Marinomonas algicola TaxID=2773454 RepID=UPI0017492D32|nr:EAL domain-containing protein [Marinomonas algicola]